MLDGDVTDITEAQSLSFSPHYIDVYLSSWGPGDDGATLEGPGPLALRTLQNAVKNVRENRKNVGFVFKIMLYIEFECFFLLFFLPKTQSINLKMKNNHGKIVSYEKIYVFINS